MHDPPLQALGAEMKAIRALVRLSGGITRKWNDVVDGPDAHDASRLEVAVLLPLIGDMT